MTPLHANHVTVLTPLEVKNCSCFNSFIKGTNLINSLFNLFWLFFLHWNYIWYFIKAIQIRLCSRTPVVPKYIDNWINRFLAHSSHQRQLELCSEKLNMTFFFAQNGLYKNGSHRDHGWMCMASAALGAPSRSEWSTSLIAFGESSGPFPAGSELICG